MPITSSPCDTRCPRAPSSSSRAEAPVLVVAGREFAVAWSGWEAVTAAAGWFSPSYGVKVEAPVLELRASAVAVRLGFVVAPAAARTELEDWLRSELAS